MRESNTCVKLEYKFSYMLESNGKDRQDYHVFADMAISSVSINWLRSKPTEWHHNKDLKHSAPNPKAVGHVFTAGVCLDFDMGEGCTDSLHVQLSPIYLYFQMESFFACPSCGGYVSILYRLMHMVAGEACPMCDPRKYQDYIDLFQFSRPKSNSSFTDFNQQENSF